MAAARKDPAPKAFESAVLAARPKVTWVTSMSERLTAEDASYREGFGEGQLGWVAASSANRRGMEPDNVMPAQSNIRGTEGLSEMAKAAALELQKVRQMGKTDPSFQCARHTMVIQGRPTQAIF